MLARALYGPQWKSGFMVFLNAYFDASLDKDGNRVVVAGYAGESYKFDDAQRRWENLLKVDGFEDFHLHDFRHRYRDDKWGEEVARYVNVLGTSGLFAIVAQIDSSVWDEISSEQRVKRLFRRPQHACLDLAFSTLADSLAGHVPSENVTVVTDNDYGKRAFATAVYDNWEARTGRSFANFTVAKAAESKKIIPLQFADLLANCIRLNPMHWAPMGSLSKDDMDISVRFPLNGAMKQGRLNRWTHDMVEQAGNAAIMIDDLICLSDFD